MNDKAEDTLKQLKALFAELPAKHKKDIAEMVRKEKARDEATHRAVVRKKNPIGLRKYDLWVTNLKTGREVRLTEYPMSHKEVMTMKSKQTKRPESQYEIRQVTVKSREGENYIRDKNPVPKGTGAKIEQAKRRYKSFRDQPVTGTVKIKAPKYEVGAKIIGYCKAIDYTTYRGEENNFEKYRHKFDKECAPVIMKSADGHYWSSGGRFRFTYRGFLDQPKAVDTKADIPPFETALVVGALDGLHIVTGRGQKLLSFKGKKVLLCVSESGYNFFTVQEP